MCRAKGGPGGGRRCHGCIGPEGKAKHNERRRNNRTIKKNVIAWARREGYGETEIAMLEQAPPKVAKEWARDRGVVPERFLDGIPDQSLANEPIGPPEPSPRPPAPAAPPVSPPRLAPGAPAAPGHGHGGVGGGAGGGRGGGGGQGAGIRQPTPPPVMPAREQSGWTTESWCTQELREQINVAMSQQGGHRDERALLDGVAENVVTLKRSDESGSGPEGGTNTTRRIELHNGVTGYFKPFAGVNGFFAAGFGQDSAQQSLHEVAAWQLAREMGPPWSEVVPPVVVREINGELGSFALARPGKDMVMAPWSTGEWRESAFFDSLIGQQDRHPGNYLVSGDRIALIDHGYTFARPGDYKNYSWLALHRRDSDPALSYDERQVLQRLVSSPSLMGLKEVLQPARAQALKARAERMLATGRITTDF